jgi:hypothetical protein
VLRRFAGEINYADILAAFATFPVFMAFHLDPVRKTNEVKTTLNADYHEQLAAVGAFDFLLPLLFLFPLCPVSAECYGRPKFGREAVYFNDIQYFFLNDCFQFHPAPFVKYSDKTEHE